MELHPSKPVDFSGSQKGVVLFRAALKIQIHLIFQQLTLNVKGDARDNLFG